MKGSRTGQPQVSGTHAEETAKARILKKHPGRMSAFCFAALGTRFPSAFPGPGGSVSGFRPTREVTW